MRRLHFEAVGLASVLMVILVSSSFAQHHDATSQPSQQHAHGTSGAAGQWEGSPAGKVYSEFNHHLAGVFVLLIGVSELRGAMGVAMLAWLRFLLPAALLCAGGYLMIWSDHDAWPIGSLSFTRTFFSDDYETIQHKLFAILLLVVGSVELFRRMGRARHAAWGAPLPVLALVGGLMLFLHSHGAHPSAHQIAFHHGMMCTMAILAGMCKLTADPFQTLALSGDRVAGARSGWGLAWSALVLLIGVELLIYTE
jgi:putative copper resistance protein D